MSANQQSTNAKARLGTIGITIVLVVVSFATGLLIGKGGTKKDIPNRASLESVPDTTFLIETPERTVYTVKPFTMLIDNVMVWSIPHPEELPTWKVRQVTGDTTILYYCEEVSKKVAK